MTSERSDAPGEIPARGAAIPGHVTLAELERPCGRCLHQNAVHTGGAKPGGWAIYEPTWANATGWCKYPGCDCPRRIGMAVT